MNIDNYPQVLQVKKGNRTLEIELRRHCICLISMLLILNFLMTCFPVIQVSISFMDLSRSVKVKNSSFVALNRFSKVFYTFSIATKFSILTFNDEILHNLNFLDFYNHVKLLTRRWKFLWMTMHIQRKL